ncbi:MAG: hypothetical protein IIW72_00375, partial [Clostridia bacterium]|nr:hypothetical protein [Clostridia bacterium]
KKKMLEKIKNELNEFDYVISLSDRLKHFENKNEDTTLMTATPVIALKKCVELIKVNLKEDKLALVVTKLTDKSKEICVKLCKNMRFVCLYEKEESDLSEIILNDTGVCVTKGKYPEITEKAAIYVGDNLEIKDNETKKTYYDIEYQKDDYKHKYLLPMDEILKISIKCSDDDSYVKSKKVKIRGLKSKYW